MMLPPQKPAKLEKESQLTSKTQPPRGASMSLVAVVHAVRYANRYAYYAQIEIGERRFRLLIWQLSISSGLLIIKKRKTKGKGLFK
jgi:hypothetical protein